LASSLLLAVFLRLFLFFPQRSREKQVQKVISLTPKPLAWNFFPLKITLFSKIKKGGLVYERKRF
jgi:hypothetical protein